MKLSITTITKRFDLKQIIASSISTFICASVLSVSTLPISVPSVKAQNTLADFSVLPETLAGDVSANPNILIILDNSGSMGRFSPNENLGVGNIRDPLNRRYIIDGITGTRYLRNRTAWDASSSMSNSFQVRQAMIRVLSDEQFANRINVGLMAFDTEECTYDSEDNNALDPDTAAEINATNLLYECRDINNEVIGDPSRRGFDRSTTGLGLLRANVENLTGAHRERLLQLLAPEPSPYVNELNGSIKNIGTRNFGDEVIDAVVLGTPPTTLSPELEAAEFLPAIGAGSQISLANPIHGILHPFLRDTPNTPSVRENYFADVEFPILSSPDNAYSNSTPLSGSIDSAFRYLLRNDTAVDARFASNTAMTTQFANGLTNREISLVNPAFPTNRLADFAVQFPTADQCEGDFIVILLTDGVASQSAPNNILTGIGQRTGQRASSAGTLDAVASAERLRLRGSDLSEQDFIDSGETPIDLHVIGFNLNGEGLLSANAIAQAGGTDAAVEANTIEGVENAFASILSEALNEGGSRSSVAVVSGADSAIGSFVQPGFVPKMELEEDSPDEEFAIANDLPTEVSWVGQLSNFFIDEFGNFREDTNSDGVLTDADLGFLITSDLEVDITHVTTFTVADDGSAVPGSVQGALVDGSTTSTEPELAFDPFIEVSDLNPIWSANDVFNELPKDNASVSQNRVYGLLPGAAGGRHIFTSLLDPATEMLDTVDFVWSDEENPDAIDPDEVGVFDLPEANSGISGDLNPAAENLINFIRGLEGIDDFRNRTLTGADGVSESFLLGDIVHSTPAQVEAPMLSPTIANSAEVVASFTPFAEHYIDRRRMIYVGANDGMLHAFNGGFWDGLDEDDTDTAGEPRPVSVATTPQPQAVTTGDDQSFALGQEMWAYVPNAVLPHLKFLSDPSYLADTHVAYVDGSTRAYDVKLFDNAGADNCADIAEDATGLGDCRYVNGWGTILVVGLRYGGAPYTGDLDNDPDTDVTWYSM